MSKTFDEFLVRREAASHDYIRGDAAALDDLLTRADPATFLPPSGAILTGAEAVREAQVGGASAFGPDGVGTFEVLASGSGDGFGYLVGRQVATVTLGGGAPTDMTLRITEVFRHEHGDWRLVHRHADVVDG